MDGGERDRGVPACVGALLAFLLRCIKVCNEQNDAAREYRERDGREGERVSRKFSPDGVA